MRWRHEPGGFRRRPLAACLPLCLLAACAGNGDGVDAGSGTPIGPTIESIQDHVFTPYCVDCHSGATAPEGLHLEDAQTSYDNLVNVASMEFPVDNRVTPGDPDNSYLIHKLEGTQEVGGQMPLGKPPLPQDTIDVIRQWITNGAPPPGSS